MELNTEFFIHLESNFNRILYNNDINKVHFYSELYNYTVKIQQLKHKDSRKDIIEFYSNMINKVKFIIDNFLNNMFEKIASSNEILQSYFTEFNLFHDSLITINNLMDYFKVESKKMDTTYTDINYINYGFTKWYDYVTFKLIKYINSKLCYYLDYKNKVSDDDETIYYLSEALDSIYHCLNKNLINQDAFINNIGNEVLSYLEKTLINLDTNIIEDKEFLGTIYEINTFHTNKLNELNLDILINDYEHLFKSLILDKYEVIIKLDFLKLLNDFDFESFKHTYTINDIFYTSFKNSIKYCHDIQYIKDAFTQWLNGLIICVNDFPEILDIYYFMTMIVDKIHCQLDINSSSIFKNIFSCFESHFKPINSTIENIDKYIRIQVYKNNLIPVNYFHKMLINYFNTFVENDDETVFIYYKNYLVKRLYYYNFNESYIKHELDIINSLTDNIDTPCLYKLNIIKKDIINSTHLSTEFNSIYNQNNNLIIITDGIWNLSPKCETFSNIEFNSKFNSFKTEFTTFYNCKFENKKLDWNHQLSTCSLTYDVFKTGTDVEIVCSLSLANILCEFNIQDYLELHSVYSKRDFEILCHYKLIIKSVDNRFILNDMFNPKGHKLNIKNNVTNKKIKKKCKNEIVFSQTEIIELFIVRTLKSVEFISDEDLLTMIKTKYNIEIKMINDILDKLVDNKYVDFVNNKYLYVI